MIFSDFAKALAQVADPRFLRVLLLGFGLTLALLFGAYAVLLQLIQWLTPETLTLPYVGEITWVDDLLSWGSILFMLLLSMFLMVPVASVFTSLFLEDIARAVEDRHYPHLPAAPKVTFGEGLRDTSRFLGLLVVANLLALALYGMLPPFAPLIFWGLNGLLLGREYFQLAAMRRLGRQGADEMRKQHFWGIWLAGVLMVVPLTIPLLNLLVPILGAATFTHLFHRLQARGPSG